MKLSPQRVDLADYQFKASSNSHEDRKMYGILKAVKFGFDQKLDPCVKHVC